MGRSPCCSGDAGLKKGPWSPEEDEKLLLYVETHGHGSWRSLPKLAGLNRCGKSCRLRWTNYLRPDIKRGKFSTEEENTILNLHSVLGNKWSMIAMHLPGRTDNEIKNFWNTHMKKRLTRMGLDPMTHRPRTDLLSTLHQLVALASLRSLIISSTRDEHASQIAELRSLINHNSSYNSEQIGGNWGSMDVIECANNMCNSNPTMHGLDASNMGMDLDPNIANVDHTQPIPIIIDEEVMPFWPEVIVDDQTFMEDFA